MKNRLIHGFLGRLWRTRTCLLCLLVFLLAGVAGATSAEKLDPEIAKLEGFVASEDYEGVWTRTVSDGEQEFKVIKDGRWAVKRCSARGVEVVDYHGGSYVVPGDVFVETVDFVESGDTNIIGRSFVYRIELEGALLRQVGMEAGAETIEWSRVEIAVTQDPTEAFSMRSLAIINTESSSGSGFVVGMDGKKYLITNQHVLDCMESIKITTLDNVRVLPVGFEINRNLDLVRLEITNDIPELAIQQVLPSIGDAVTVYGNSAGGGVATEIKGKLKGVGPDLVEVDAEFVEGNSGCPLLNADDEVIAVASYATLYRDPENIMSKDTRFQEIRRYGIRLSTADWVVVSPNLYRQQTQVLSDQEHAVIMYAGTYLTFRNYLREPLRYNYVTNERGEVTKRTERDNYQNEYAFRRHLVEMFESVKPDADDFYSDELYKRCALHYEQAAKAFTAQRIDLTKAHAGEMHINYDSIRNLQSTLDELKKQRYISKYLLDKSDKLVSICEYVLELHEQK